MEIEHSCGGDFWNWESIKLISEVISPSSAYIWNLLKQLHAEPEMDIPRRYDRNRFHFYLQIIIRRYYFKKITAVPSRAKTKLLIRY